MLFRVVLRGDPPVLEAHIRHWAIEQVRGDQGEFLAGFLQHGIQRRAPGDQAPAGRSTPTSGQYGGIAVQHPDICGRHTQRIGYHLGKGCRRALAVG